MKLQDLGHSYGFRIDSVEKENYKFLTTNLIFDIEDRAK